MAMVRIKRHSLLISFRVDRQRPYTIATITPARKNRSAANWSGDWYCSPILIPAKAVDHKSAATMARKVVDLRIFFITGFEVAKVKKISRFCAAK
jgi:hypothetical protein